MYVVIMALKKERIKYSVNQKERKKTLKRNRNGQRNEKISW